MEIFLIVLQIVLILSSVAFAFVIYEILKAEYERLKRINAKEEKPFLLFRLSPRAVSILFLACFLALVL